MSAALVVAVLVALALALLVYEMLSPVAQALVGLP